MTSVRAAPHRAAFPALGTTAVLLVTDGTALAEGERLLRDWLAEVDAAYSRFRDDSEIVRLGVYAGRAAPVSPLLAGALHAALCAAAATDGLVDPTVGQAMVDLGYDRDFDLLAPDGAAPAPRPAPGYWKVRLDAEARQVVVPRGIRLDLGSTGKAYAADRAAAQVAALGCGALVSLGGDLATAGPAPEGGWLVGIGDDHRAPAAGDPVVTVRSGALATSSVTQRAWRRGGRAVHHIVDPRTGDLPAPVWRTVSVAARTCVDANAAATAAIVRGEGADAWLDGAGLPARLVGHDGRVVTVGGWRSHA
ncbi:FAD:protein FMN transferase [Phytohabitans sp. ZYX-F-186]|uniref:FAD:protein FMN transferase n=1 Tax=Phytohabitans maris TaxID=3071409 RepID=A0ABU0ZP75_9ACTN|nr:FAD:protein FMN transferase [Phytohabitans sp. ZYX-F-186]MDQ7908835.1 FAD:protein FMN transferase [Phytohabitans sp. ZYX-F-186]